MSKALIAVTGLAVLLDAEAVLVLATFTTVLTADGTTAGLRSAARVGAVDVLVTWRIAVEDVAAATGGADVRDPARFASGRTALRAVVEPFDG